jgi:hypothetical protein
MIPADVTILRGEVISASPLKIQIAGDEKLILGEGVLCVPRHLTDYETTCDIALSGGDISSETTGGEGAHAHGPSGGHSQYEGDGVHSHPSSEGAHTHSIATFEIKASKIKIYNALKTGDQVFIISFNSGKKYYVLDIIRE